MNSESPGKNKIDGVSFFFSVSPRPTEETNAYGETEANISLQAYPITQTH